MRAPADVALMTIPITATAALSAVLRRRFAIFADFIVTGILAILFEKLHYRTRRARRGLALGG
jgi:hypothetical protein